MIRQNTVLVSGLITFRRKNAMNTKELRNIHALVTGASSGQGFSMAEALLHAGATVALASRVGIKLDQAVEKLKSEGYPAVGRSFF